MCIDVTERLPLMARPPNQPFQRIAAKDAAPAERDRWRSKMPILASITVLAAMASVQLRAAEPSCGSIDHFAAESTNELRRVVLTPSAFERAKCSPQNPAPVLTDLIESDVLGWTIVYTEKDDLRLIEPLARKNRELILAKKLHSHAPANISFQFWGAEPNHLMSMLAGVCAVGVEENDGLEEKIATIKTFDDEQDDFCLSVATVLAVYRIELVPSGSKLRAEKRQQAVPADRGEERRSR